MANCEPVTQDSLLEQMYRSQGSHECHVPNGKECDLVYVSCKKNPEHTGFIPVDTFKRNSLPGGYQNSSVFQCVQALAQLVVRLSVAYTSANRPDFESNTNIPYAFAEFKGTSAPRIGSGWLREVINLSTLMNWICPCESCRLSKSPNTKGAKLVVRTAAHVVHDREEGRHTTCHFFFDQGVSVEDCDTAAAFTGAFDVISEVTGDWCDMTFITHDEDQAERFAKMTADYEKLHQKVWDDYPQDTIVKDSPLGENLKLAVIISHPRGCSKTISLGCFQRRKELSMYDHFTQYMYTTATCNGSSGAPVFILGNSRRWPWCSHPHSGHCGPDSSLNYSGLGTN